MGRIAAEFVRGFRALHFVGPCVTVFGSARFKEHHPYYLLARAVGARMAELGVTTMTGGGPGIMEAANRGAKEAGGHSIGCNIELPAEQHENQYLDRFITFRYFFVRKVMLVKYSVAFVVMPGGFGTLDELFEALTLVQTKKIEMFPVVLMGVAYWSRLLDFIRGTLVRNKTIDAADTRLLTVTDSPDEAAAAVERALRQYDKNWKAAQARTRCSGRRQPSSDWRFNLLDRLNRQSSIVNARSCPGSKDPQQPRDTGSRRIGELHQRRAALLELEEILPPAGEEIAERPAQVRFVAHQRHGAR